MDAHVLNLAIPDVTADLRPTGAELLWIVDAYGFLIAGFLLTMGALGDRLGRRRLLLAGAAGFGVASLLAAFSTHPLMLIAARALLGVAGATLMPSTLALIRVLFPVPRQRRTALGIWTASFALGGIIAPVVAGLMLHHFWWGSVFLVALPVMAGLLVLGPVLLPECRDPRAGRVDVAGIALSLLGVLSVVFGIKRAAEHGPDAAAMATVAAGLVAGALFVRRQLRRPDPWIDPALFRRRAFSLPLVANAVGFLVLYGTSLFVVQHMQLVLGLSPLEAGLWTVPASLGFLAGSALGSLAAGRVPPALLMGAGLAVAAAGFGLLSQLDARSGLAPVVAASIIFSLGLAPVYLLATEMTVASAPPERTGAASGVLETGAELGGALGIALLGSLGAARFRDAMAASFPAGMPQDAWAEASRTLGGAIAAAERLPGPLGPELVASAREAFVAAFRTVEVVGASILAVLAVTVVVLLRHATLDTRDDG
jgi:DHA2 family multidrug resistance protein-like MFS transporter